MTRLYLAFLVIILLLTACSNNQSLNIIEDPTPTSIINNTNTEGESEEFSIIIETETDQETEALEPLILDDPIEPEPTPTSSPIFVAERENIFDLMKKYNYEDTYHLSDEYWEKLDDRISKYGKAERILALEFHGDEYDMYDSNYAMSVESFTKQISELMENDYHFVTVHELQGFVSGWLDLPKRSVILTTDPGKLVWESTERMVQTFTELDATFGYKPHMITFIVSYGMNEIENFHCKENRCWLAYINAVESSYFSLGTHTHWHNYHDSVTEYSAKLDIQLSQNLIFENTGIQVYALSWPYEVCSPYTEMLVNELGITLGFGGVSRPGDNYVQKSDPQFLCMPRLFPENPNGYSGRPAGNTLQDMLFDAMNTEK